MSVEFCDFQGLVDVAKEITKLDGKKEKLNSQLAKLREAIEAPGYATKVQVLPKYVTKVKV